MLTHWRTNQQDRQAFLYLKLLSLIPDLIITPCLHYKFVFDDWGISRTSEVGKVIPVHKGGSTQDIRNYRHISLLSIFDKIIENIVCKNLYFFLEVHNILFQNQFGFRRNNSSTNGLIQITELIKKSIDKGKYGCGIFYRFEKGI